MVIEHGSFNQVKDIVQKIELKISFHRFNVILDRFMTASEHVSSINLSRYFMKIFYIFFSNSKFQKTL